MALCPCIMMVHKGSKIPRLNTKFYSTKETTVVFKEPCQTKTVAHVSYKNTTPLNEKVPNTVLNSSDQVPNTGCASSDRQNNLKPSRKQLRINNEPICERNFSFKSSTRGKVQFPSLSAGIHKTTSERSELQTEQLENNVPNSFLFPCEEPIDVVNVKPFNVPRSFQINKDFPEFNTTYNKNPKTNYIPREVLNSVPLSPVMEMSDSMTDSRFFNLEKNQNSHNTSDVNIRKMVNEATVASNDKLASNVLQDVTNKATSKQQAFNPKFLKMPSFSSQDSMEMDAIRAEILEMSLSGISPDDINQLKPMKPLENYSYILDSENVTENFLHHTLNPITENSLDSSKLWHSDWDLNILHRKHLSTYRNLDEYDSVSTTTHPSSVREDCTKHKCSRLSFLYDPEVLLAYADHPVSLSNATFNEYTYYIKSKIIDRMVSKCTSLQNLQNPNYEDLISTCDNVDSLSNGYMSEPDINVTKRRNNTKRYPSKANTKDHRRYSESIIPNLPDNFSGRRHQDFIETPNHYAEYFKRSDGCKEFSASRKFRKEGFELLQDTDAGPPFSNNENRSRIPTQRKPTGVPKQNRGRQQGHDRIKLSADLCKTTKPVNVTSNDKQHEKNLVKSNKNGNTRLSYLPKFLRQRPQSLPNIKKPLEAKVVNQTKLSIPVYEPLKKKRLQTSKQKLQSKEASSSDSSSSSSDSVITVIPKLSYKQTAQ